MAGLLRASEEGLKIIDMVRRNLGWNKSEDTWCKAALTSKATLRRFWAQNRIRRETFIDICKAVGINNWEDIIERNDIKKTELLLAGAIADIPQEGQTDRTFPLPENLPPVRNWVQRTKEIDTLKTLITAPPLTNEPPAPAPPLTKGGAGGGSHRHLNSRITGNRKNHPHQPTNSPTPHRKNPLHLRRLAILAICNRQSTPVRSHH
jgi:hypothetical protein